MIYIITGNPEAQTATSYEENSNFLYCLLQEKYNLMEIKPTLAYSMYYAMDNISDIIEDYDDQSLTLNEVSYPSQGINHITNSIISYYKENDSDDIMVILAIDRPAKKAISDSMRKKFRSDNIDIRIMDIQDMFNISTLEDLERIIKTRLNSEFVYREDPISFAYSIYKSLGIGGAK